MLRVGLTGGIACGKSRVRQRLAEAGIHTLDLDAVAHALMAPGGTAFADVVAAFGPEVLTPDGTIDRAALGQIVFADPSARVRLNSLVHPRVREVEARQATVLAAQTGAVLVTEAALLVEAGVHLRFDRLIVAHCPPAAQLARLVARDGLPEAAARARLAAQMPVDEKLRFAHWTVDTGGSLNETDRRARALVPEVQRLASRPVPAPHGQWRQRARACLGAAAGSGVGQLDALRLMQDVLDRNGVEMVPLARAAEPSSAGSWYTEGPLPTRGAGAAGLAAPLAVWSVATRRDGEFLVAAAASLARLALSRGPAAADVCLAALLFREALLEGDLPRGAHWAECTRLAEHWGGGAPGGQVEAALESARSGDRRRSSGGLGAVVHAALGGPGPVTQDAGRIDALLASLPPAGG